MNLYLETVVIAVSVLVVFALVHMILMYVMPKQSMEHTGIFLAVFLTAAIAHLLAEAFGLNKKFCENR